MTAPRLLRAADHLRMPWKNGGGETLEVAVSPPGAALADLDWRVSMATVAVDGPFSTFPGVDRTLVVLEGDGMTLDIAGARHRLGAGDVPLAFPADVPTSATLAEGAITDLNVMTRRGRWAHLVERAEGPQDATVASGAVVLVIGDGLTVETAGGEVLLGYRDFARVDGPGEVHIGKAPDSDALLIRMWPL
jgi:uncharacterized protein